MLIVFAGLPGTGKSTLARMLAQHLGAVYLRADTIEQALRDSGEVPDLAVAGYMASYSIAEENLALGRLVIADQVNPIQITRDAWHKVAQRAGVRCVDVEVVCSDRDEHRARVEGRRAEVSGLILPTWAEVIGREVDPWDAEPIRIDTAGESPNASFAALLSALGMAPVSPLL